MDYSRRPRHGLGRAALPPPRQRGLAGDEVTTPAKAHHWRTAYDDLELAATRSASPLLPESEAIASQRNQHGDEEECSDQQSHIESLLPLRLRPAREHRGASEGELDGARDYVTHQESRGMLTRPPRGRPARAGFYAGPRNAPKPREGSSSW